MHVGFIYELHSRTQLDTDTYSDVCVCVYKLMKSRSSLSEWKIQCNIVEFEANDIQNFFKRYNN